jgi:hypothetical protein
MPVRYRAVGSVRVAHRTTESEQGGRRANGIVPIALRKKSGSVGCGANGTVSVKYRAAGTVRVSHRTTDAEAAGTVRVSHRTTDAEAAGTVRVSHRTTDAEAAETVRVSHRTTDAEADDRGETVVGSAVRRPLEWTGARS